MDYAKFNVLFELETGLLVLIGGILAVLITVFISVWAFIRKRANVDASEKKFGNVLAIQSTF